jgi:hypothetical protein
MKGLTRQQRMDFAEVQHWLYSADDRRSLFAFESICDLLGIDAGILRRRLGSISLGDLPSRRQAALGVAGCSRA